MRAPGANGSTGYCKVMKGLCFYDDVNDVAWESKKKLVRAKLGPYTVHDWTAGRLEK